ARSTSCRPSRVDGSSAQLLNTGHRGNRWRVAPSCGALGCRLTGLAWACTLPGRRSFPEVRDLPSLIAWLDASAEEQRRMRDVIRLFSDRESRDELGLGQLRDGISDALFPGTSTLLTRARYLLFVPWIYQLAARSSDPVATADRLERQLTEPLKPSSDNAGLLGTQAGVTLKALPSSVYWTMLRHYGILRDPSLSREDALAFEGRVREL